MSDYMSADQHLGASTDDMKWDFDRVTSWSFGQEINIPWYGEAGRENMFAPWRFAEVVMFYPSVFDLRSVAAGPGKASTVMMQHFVSYVRGANNLPGVAA